MKFIKNKLIFILITFVLLGVSSLIIYKYKYKVTEESIISNFNENYEYFSDIERYLDDNNRNYIYAHKEGNKVVISTKDKDESNDNLPIKPQIDYIINKLHYERIAKKNIIIFERTSKGGYEQGIVFIENNNGEYGMRMTKIRDEWYYYAIGYV